MVYEDYWRNGGTQAIKVSYCENTAWTSYSSEEDRDDGPRRLTDFTEEEENALCSESITVHLQYTNVCDEIGVEWTGMKRFAFDRLSSQD